MNIYTKHTLSNAQNEPIFLREKDMTKNNAGGYSFKVDRWTSLNRFLILGTEGGSYYAKESNLTKENATKVIECIYEDSKRTLQTVLDVSRSGRAPKQGPTLYVLALLCVYAPENLRSDIYNTVPLICRTGTMLFEFVDNITQMKKGNGWSAGLRKAVAKYYTQKDLHMLDLHFVKYRQRGGWSHQDLLRLSHPKALTEKQNEFFGYVTGHNEAPLGSLLETYENLKGLQNTGKSAVDKVVNAIIDTGLPREGVPTHFMNEARVWEALLEKMPIGALMRNLGNISKAGLTHSNTGAATRRIVELLTNDEAIKKSRIHPMNILVGLKTYQMGRGFKGNGIWTPNTKIMEACDSAFYKAFVNAPKTGKTFMHAFDVSGSMSSAVGTNLSAYEAEFALALPSMAVEDNYESVAFSADGGASMSFDRNRFGWGNAISTIDISPKRRLIDNVREARSYGFGGTDCSLPMLYAMQKKISVDCFIVYTDSETWAGKMHPKQALDQYRQKMGINAKMIVVGLESNKFSIADPKDSGMLDVVGFDTSVPAVISTFAKGF